MKVVIMAGGSGTRLRPITCTLPKPMVPVMNTPVLEHTLRLLRRHGVYRAAVTLGYLPDMVKRYFGDGERVGMQLDYFVEDEPLGTAGSVLSAGADRDRTLVLSGDALTDINLTAVLEYHERHGAAATIVLKQVDCPLEYGVAVTSQKGVITRFIEKPDWSLALSDRVNTGIYVLEPSVWEGFSSGERFDFSKDLFPKLLERGVDIYGCVTDGYWCDIGCLDAYIKAHCDVFDGVCRIDLPRAKYADGCFVEDGAVLEPGCVVKGPCYLGADCRVKSGAAIDSYTVLGSDAVVGCGASVRRTIIGRNTHIGAFGELRGAVVCANVTTGRRASVFERAVVADGTTLGDDACVKGGVSVWPEKNVPNGETLCADCRFGDSVRDYFSDCSITGASNELTSELCARIARAVASVAGAGSRIALASDGSALAVMARHAVAAGLMEGGADVCDLGRAALPAARFGTRELRTHGGVFASRQGDRLSLRILDGTGADAGRGAMRDIALSCTDGGRRAHADALGMLCVRCDITPFYTSHLYSLVDERAMRERGGYAALVGEGEELAFLCELLSGCGITTEVIGDPREAARSARRRGGSAIGVVSGELRVYCAGETLFGGSLALLFAAVDMMLGERLIYTDVTADAKLEELAAKHRARVVRLPRRELLRALEGQYSLTGELWRDPFSAALALFFRLGELGMTAEQISAKLPLAKRAERVLPVESRDIGRIFRAVAEDGEADTTEGVRLRRGSGWVNVLPDPHGRRIHISAQAFSEEYADSLADFYAKRIKRLADSEADKKGE